MVLEFLLFLGPASFQSQSHETPQKMFSIYTNKLAETRSQSVSRDSEQASREYIRASPYPLQYEN